MDMTLNEVNAFLQSKGWKGSHLFYPELHMWNRNATVEEAYEWFLKHRESCFRSLKAEFQASHSAMSAKGAEAYANNWN